MLVSPAITKRSSSRCPILVSIGSLETKVPTVPVNVYTGSNLAYIVSYWIPS